MPRNCFFKALTCLAVCLLTAILFCASLPVSADVPEAPSLARADAVCLYHVASGKKIYAKNSDLTVAAGTSVRVLSGLLFCETLAERLDEEVVITDDMVSAAGTFYRLKLRDGDVLSVRDLLNAAICGGCNDAYFALAHVVSGSVPDFVDLMNRRARELGAAHSLFTDPCGVDESSTTTADDTVTVALAATQNSLFMQISSMDHCSMPSIAQRPSAPLYNRNALISSSTTTLYHNSKCKGLSAASNTHSGSCVVTLVSNGKEEYVSVVLGADDDASGNHGYLITNELTDWVYRAYTYMEVLSAEEPVCRIPVTVSDLTKSVDLIPDAPVSAYLPVGTTVGKEVTYSIRLISESIEAPFPEHTFVGYVAILYQGEIVGTAELYTALGAERSGFVSRLTDIKYATKQRPFVAGVVFFVICLSGWITVEEIVSRKRKRKWNRYFQTKRRTGK